MNTQKQVFNKLFSNEKVELASQKFEFALTDDFNNIYNSANNNQKGISDSLTKSVIKAANDYKSNISDWQKVKTIGKQISDKSKELGVDVPTSILNQIKQADLSIKENANYLNKIDQLTGIL